MLSWLPRWGSTTKMPTEFKIPKEDLLDIETEWQILTQIVSHSFIKKLAM